MASYEEVHGNGVQAQAPRLLDEGVPWFAFRLSGCGPLSANSNFQALMHASFLYFRGRKLLL